MCAALPGKSLVAELLLCRMLAQQRKRALLVLPYISLADEFAERLSTLFGSMKGLKKRDGKGFRRSQLKIEAVHGSKNSASIDQIDVVVCTIEKARARACRSAREWR